MGPTASGKSALALDVAEAIGAEIISVDSAQVYRGMDIGTAKPDAAERRRVPHHLIDVRDPEQSFSAADFAELAACRMREIIARGRTPLLVGGTMLYFRALLEGLDPMPEIDPAVRAALRARLPEVGAQGLHRELSAVDAAAAARIHPNDPQRILRALEVFFSTGRPLSSFQSGERRRPPAHWRSLALWPEDRARLRRRIAERFDAMLDAGFTEELERLAARPHLTAEHVSQRAVGYRQGWRWLSGFYGLDEFRQRSIDATRQLAKRQLTWLRGQQGIERLCAETADVGAVLARLAR
ncbi:tRNA delta(2)-isopentenylpyrophosphate transferase [Thioalkalivibrio paradoxus ARh 1]|uniref:tRNA dimethylallyltransferase n=2 Tax=Thioalkalivibrio paradoxus TaxID=108010 RepID=W0DQE0_9GAMM|nr:tRNA delta(2)-isopentenylpyrophosphate transferase [Thioalkalivibrio paradoxus ARh 1]